MTPEREEAEAKARELAMLFPVNWEAETRKEALGAMTDALLSGRRAGMIAGVRMAMQDISACLGVNLPGGDDFSRGAAIGRYKAYCTVVSILAELEKEHA